MSDQAKILDATLKTTVTEVEGETIVNTYQDVEPHIEYAKALARLDAEERGHFGKRRELRQTMAIPMNVMLMVAQRLGIPAGKILESEYSRRIVAELKKPEFKVFRTTCDKRI